MILDNFNRISVTDPFFKTRNFDSENVEELESRLFASQADLYTNTDRFSRARLVFQEK